MNTQPLHPKEPLWLRRGMESVIEKGAYLEIFKHDPQLLHEIGPQLFLDTEDEDVILAAKRIALYWEERRTAFGDRAYRPLLDTSGEAALSEEDLEHLRKGSLVVTGTDANGRPLLVNDGTRTKEDHDGLIDMRIRGLFYIMGRLAKEYPMSQLEGCVFIKKITASAHGAQRRVKIPQLLETVFPIKIHSKYMCSTTDSAGMRSFEKLVFPLMPRLVEGATKVLKESPDEIGQELFKHGIPMASLPPAFGGTWSYKVHEVQLKHTTFHLTSSAIPELPYSYNEVKRKVQEVYDKNRKLDSLRLQDVFFPIPEVREPILTWNPIKRRQALKQRIENLYRKNRTVKANA